MPPTIVGVGAVDSASPWAPALHASTAADDIILIIVESTGGETAPAATGYAHVASDATPVSPVVQGTNTQLSVLWKRAGASESAPTVTGPTDHAVTRTISIRGCPTTGNPWHIVAVATSATSSTAASWPGVTTTVDDTLVLEIIATGADVNSTAGLGALTNGSYTSIAEQMDNWTNAGNGGGIGCVSATKATAGATGASTATLGTAATKAYMTLAFLAATGGGVAPQVLHRSPRPAEQHTIVGAYAPTNPSTILPGG